MSLARSPCPLYPQVGMFPRVKASGVGHSWFKEMFCEAGGRAWRAWCMLVGHTAHCTPESVHATPPSCLASHVARLCCRHVSEGPTPHTPMPRRLRQRLSVPEYRDDGAAAHAGHVRGEEAACGPVQQGRRGTRLPATALCAIHCTPHMLRCQPTCRMTSPVDPKTWCGKTAPASFPIQVDELAHTVTGEQGWALTAGRV